MVQKGAPMILGAYHQ